MATTITEIKKDVLKQDIIEGQPCVFSYGTNKELRFGIVVESRVKVKVAYAWESREWCPVTRTYKDSSITHTSVQWTSPERLVMITEERLYELLDGPTLLAMGTIMGQVREEIAKVEARKERKRLKEAKAQV